MAQAVCAELAPLAIQKDQQLELDVSPDLPPVIGNADLLAMLLANLVDNAIHYTPKGGCITVGVHQVDSFLQLEVSDNGPGIAPEHREQMFARFSRMPDQMQSGTGLGLAIARRIAELHSARIELVDSPLGRGITAQVWIPAMPNVEIKQ
jgi:signal transduction histidine kinase